MSNVLPTLEAMKKALHRFSTNVQPNYLFLNFFSDIY